MPSLLVLLPVLLFALAGSLAAQEPAAGDLIIRTTTRLVTVSVVVRDRDGKPVSGLKAEDFTLTDEGKRQQVQIWDQQTAAPQLPSARMGLPAELPPDIHTNFQGVALPRNAAVILLDGLNTPIVDQRYTRLQILKFLERLHPDDRIGIYILGRKLQVLHDFTGDTRSLLKQLGRYQGEIDANPATVTDVTILMNEAKLEAAMRDPGVWTSIESQIVADQNIALAKLEDRVLRTIGALEAIAHHLASVPGRKSLLWVSAAFPSVVATDVRTATGSPATFGEEATRAVRALANAGVSIYPIDARGVMVDPGYKASVTSNERNMARFLSATRSRGRQVQNRFPLSSPDPMVYANRDETKSHHDIMQELAQRTGGRAFLNANDTGKALREALDDGAGAYTLGYYPSQADESGKFHRIQVKLSCAGCSARHREGYFAAAARPEAAGKQHETMMDVLSAPLQASDVPMAVQAVILPDQARKLRVTIRLDAAAILLRESRGRFLGRVDIVALFLDAAGASKGGAEESVSLDLTTAQRDDALRQGFNYRQTLPMPEGAHTMVLAARDAATGRMGTVRLELSKLETALP